MLLRGSGPAEEPVRCSRRPCRAGHVEEKSMPISAARPRTLLGEARECGAGRTRLESDDAVIRSDPLGPVDRDGATHRLLRRKRDRWAVADRVRERDVGLSGRASESPSGRRRRAVRAAGRPRSNAVANADSSPSAARRRTPLRPAARHHEALEIGRDRRAPIEAGATSGLGFGRERHRVVDAGRSCAGGPGRARVRWGPRPVVGVVGDREHRSGQPVTCCGRVTLRREGRDRGGCGGIGKRAADRVFGGAGLERRAGGPLSGQVASRLDDLAVTGEATHHPFHLRHRDGGLTVGSSPSTVSVGSPATGGVAGGEWQGHRPDRSSAIVGRARAERDRGHGEEGHEGDSLRATGRATPPGRLGCVVAVSVRWAVARGPLAGCGADRETAVVRIRVTRAMPPRKRALPPTSAGRPWGWQLLIGHSSRPECTGPRPRRDQHRDVIRPSIVVVSTDSALNSSSHRSEPTEARRAHWGRAQRRPSGVQLGVRVGGVASLGTGGSGSLTGTIVTTSLSSPSVSASRSPTATASHRAMPRFGTSP